LGKPIGDEAAAESWEIVDHGETQSVVKFGALAGQTLRQLIETDGEGILGGDVLAAVSSDSVPGYLQNRFPLLLKFLDANRHLSIQVHPDDEFGSTLSPPDLGKTEAWYVMAAEPGSKIYAGLKKGVDQQAFSAAVEQGQTESMMHSFEPEVGDCVFIPAGTMHAIGEGLLIAEIQQASDTTFRVYDWGRVGDDGKSRPLHIDQSIAATDFARGPVSASPAVEIAPGVVELVSCEKFVMRRHELSAVKSFGGDGRFRILAVISGEVTLSTDPAGVPLESGQTALLPAKLDAVSATAAGGRASLLEIFVEAS
jgi:mannose-6-phosphate isomerase